MTARAERGSATLAASGVLGLLLVLGGALGVVAAMVHGHRLAQSAADLAALAGARAAGLGQDPCTAAAGIAAANGAALDACAASGPTGADVRLTVTVPGPRWLGQPHDLSAQARAGPAAVPAGLAGHAGSAGSAGVPVDPAAAAHRPARPP